MNRPRPNDHLVEPLFGGLGVEEEVDVPGRRRGRFRWWWIVAGAVAGVIWFVT